MDYSARYSTRNSPIRNREDCVLVFVSNFFFFHIFFSNCTLVASRFFSYASCNERGSKVRAKLRVNGTHVWMMIKRMILMIRMFGDQWSRSWHNQWEVNNIFYLNNICGDLTKSEHARLLIILLFRKSWSEGDTNNSDFKRSQTSSDLFIITYHEDGSPSFRF